MNYKIYKLLEKVSTNQTIAGLMFQQFGFVSNPLEILFYDEEIFVRNFGQISVNLFVFHKPFVTRRPKSP